MYSILHIESVKNIDEEKILSIALFRYENNEVLDQLVSILNPETLVSDQYEVRLGLSNKRLRKAPKFYEIAKRVLEIIEGTILICFDKKNQSFILKKEFERLGYPLDLEIFDLKYELTKMNIFSKNVTLAIACKEFGIPFTHDFSNKLNGLALVKLFKIIKEKDIEKQLNQRKEIFSIEDQNLFKIQRDLPHEVGVFYIHNKKGEIIFLEKSMNVHNSVNQLFTSQSMLSENIRNHTDYITFDITGSELIASIKAQIEIEKIIPLLNKKRPIEKECNVLFDESISFLITDKGRVVGEESFVFIKKGAIIGYGYYDLNIQVNTLNKVEKLVTKINETKEIRTLVRSFIKEKKYLEIIDL